MKKVKCGVSLILAALMLLSVFAIAPVSAFAAGGKTVTFVPGEANEASPVWFAWTWTKDSEGDWVTGTKKGENVTFGGILENVVFVRMPAGSTEPDWDTAWNQTEDLTTDGNVFTFTEWKEIKGKSYMAGEWTTEGNTDPTTSSDNKEGTYTATLDTAAPTTEATEATTAAAPTTEATEPTTTAAPTTEATEPTTTAEPTTEATEATTAEPTTEATEATTAEPVTETATVEPTTAAPTTEPATTEPPTTQPATEKEKVDISKWDVIGIVNATYNGKAITQKVLVTDNVNVAQYDVSYTDNVNAGTATMIITGKDGYTGTIVKHFKIYKAKQKPTVKAKKKKVKVKALSAKKVLVKKSITVKNGIGAVSYKKVSGSKFLKISKKGVITVKKGTYKKGKTLKIKVKVTVKGNANYASFSKKVTVKIKTK